MNNRHRWRYYSSVRWPLADADKANVQAQIENVRSESLVQVVLRDYFVANAEIQPYFGLADVVLALYQHHVGMSAILVRAAATGKPVLASDYGLMGDWVRRRRLGMAVNSSLPSEIVMGFQAYLQEKVKHQFDDQSVACFASENSASQFTQRIYACAIGEENTTDTYA